MVGAPPRLVFLQVLDNVLLVDQDEAVEAELLLARSRLVVSIALIPDLASGLAHVAVADFHKRDSGVSIEGLLAIVLPDQLLLCHLALLCILRILLHYTKYYTDNGRPP